MAESSISALDFLTLDRGVLAVAPPRALQDPAGQFLWRDSLNMIARDGKIIGRPGILSNAGGVVTAQPPALVMAGGGVMIEKPRWISTYRVGPGGGTLVVLLTTRSILLGAQATWVDATPTYAVGTVTATNGSPNITGAGGMLWSTHNVGGIITIDGETYDFNRTGETSGTISPNFLGGTGGGKGYVITRTFSISSTPFAVMYNRDLYIAATMYGSIGGAIIKVANVLSMSPTVTFLFGGALFQASQHVDSDFVQPAGITVLQDGRIVTSAISTTGVCAVFWSSHLNTAVWTTAPGGKNVIADMPSGLIAQGQIGSTLTFHSSRSIVLADPTGLSDPPLRFQPARATFGCFAPYTLQQYAGGEAFLCLDGEVRVFDGNASYPIAGDGDSDIKFRNKQLGFGVSMTADFFAGVLPARNAYVLFRAGEGTIGVGPTKFWIFQDGVWWACQASMDITAVHGIFDGEPTGAAITQALLGTHFSSSDSVFLRAMEEGSADGFGAAPTYMLETDDLDHNAPLQLKTPQRVHVWPVAAMTDLVVSCKTAQSGGYSHTVTKSPAAQVPTAFDFVPNAAADIPAATAHRYKISGTTLRLGLLAMRIASMIGGDVQQSGQ